MSHFSSVVLSVAILQGGRMAAKVSGANCGICNMERLWKLTNLILKHAGKWSKGKKGLPGLRNVAAALKIKGAEDLAVEPLADKCANAMKLERPPSRAWPHTQHLGDCLRCTVECPDVQSMLRTWRRLREVFKIREGRGRLKNNLLNMKIPPDMLVRDG